MDRDTREYCPSDWESVSKVEELEAEITQLKSHKINDADFIIHLQKEIAELKRSYQILCDKYDAMEMCDNKIGADAIQEMLDATGHGLNPDWLKHFRNYADKLRGKQIEPKKKD